MSVAKANTHRGSKYIFGEKTNVAEANNKKRRIIRQAETVREKAEKKTQGDGTPKKRGIIRTAFYYLFTPLRILGKALASLERYRPFRIIGLILVPPYFRNSFRELKDVTWPNTRDSIRLTFAVLMFAIFLTLIVTAADFVLDKIFKRLLLGE